MLKIGCEVGNYDSKLISRETQVLKNLKKKGHVVDTVGMISIYNCVAHGYERRILGTSTTPLINALDITVKSKSAEGRWFIGALALKEGKEVIKPTRETLKSTNDSTVIMLLGTLAYALYDPDKKTKKETISLGTLLPTEEYFEHNGHVEDYLKKLVGRHTVTFNDPLFDGAVVEIEIVDVELLPEGAAGHMAVTYDWDGNAIDEEYTNKTVMNIDIGSIDVDISIMENGEFVSRGFMGLKGGTTSSLRDIASDIHRNHGHAPDTIQIDYHIRAGKDLRIGNKVLPHAELLDLANEHYERQAIQMSDNITENMLDQGLDKGMINEVNLIGGGAEFFFSGIKRRFETNLMAIKIADNARFKNVEGVLKSLILKKLTSNEAEAKTFVE